MYLTLIIILHFFTVNAVTLLDANSGCSNEIASLCHSSRESNNEFLILRCLMVYTLTFQIFFLRAMEIPWTDYLLLAIISYGNVVLN